MINSYCMINQKKNFFKKSMEVKKKYRQFKEEFSPHG